MELNNFNEFEEIGNLGYLEGENDFLDEATSTEETETEFLEDEPEGNGGGGFQMNLSYISPELATALLDTILVAGAVYAFSIFKKKITKAQLKMSESEKRNLEPIMKACLESVNFNVDNPWSALAMSVGFIYGSKIIMVFADEKSQEPVYNEETGEFTEPVKRGRGRPRKHFS